MTEATQTIQVLRKMPDGDGSRITNSLLETMSQEFARYNTEFFDLEDIYPLQYSEKQLESVVFTSFYLADAFVFAQEPAVSKTRGQAARNGWVDLWVLHRQVVHLVEFKFQRLSMRWTSLRGLSSRWAAGAKQARERRVASGYYGPNRKLFKTCLLITPLYRERKYKDRLEPDSAATVLKTADEVISNLRPAPDWVALWHIEGKDAGPVVSDGGYAMFPGVLFAASIQGPIQ